MHSSLILNLFYFLVIFPLLNFSLKFYDPSIYPKISLKQVLNSKKSVVSYTKFSEKENEYVVRNYMDSATILICESAPAAASQNENITGNIGWKYSGEGSPNLVQESTRLINKTFVSELLFPSDWYHVKKLPYHTGKYVCEDSKNSTLFTSVYLYFPRTDASYFLNTKPRRKLLQVERYPQPSSNYTKSTDKLVLNLPCVPTDPSKYVSLYKKVESRRWKGKWYYERVNPKIVKYNSKTGFTLSFKRGNNSNLDYAFGEYKCTIGQKDYLVYNVIEKKAVKTYPNETIVFSSSDSTLNLTCEAEEPVVIKLVAYAQLQSVYDDIGPDGEIPEDSVHYTDELNDELEDALESETEQTELETHIANYVDEKPTVGDIGEFQCVSEVNGQVLHNWIYQIITPEADNVTTGIKYNETSKSFYCQTKASIRGKLAFVNCESESECEINKHCLSKYDNCRGYRKKSFTRCDYNTDCREIYHSKGTGYIRCNEDGVDEIRGFADLPGQIYLGKDFTSLIPQNATKIYHKESKLVPNSKVRFHLMKWNYMFLREHQWFYEYKNGTKNYNSQFKNQLSALFDLSDDLAAIGCSLTVRKDLTPFNVTYSFLERDISEIASVSSLIVGNATMQSVLEKTTAAPNIIME